MPRSKLPKRRVEEIRAGGQSKRLLSLWKTGCLNTLSTARAWGAFRPKAACCCIWAFAGKRRKPLGAKYAEVWERAKLRRQDWLENKMVTDGRCANGCMNALKQEKNGGYADRTMPENKPRQLKIVMDGVGKNAAK